MGRDIATRHRQGDEPVRASRQALAPVSQKRGQLFLRYAPAEQHHLVLGTLQLLRREIDHQARHRAAGLNEFKKFTSRKPAGGNGADRLRRKTMAFAARQFQEIAGQGKPQNVMPPIGELLVNAHDALRQTINLACGFAFSDNLLAGSKTDGRRKTLQFSQFAGIEGTFAEEIREASPSHCFQSLGILLAFQFLAPATQIIEESAVTQRTLATAIACARSPHSLTTGKTLARSGTRPGFRGERLNVSPRRTRAGTRPP